MTRCEKKALNFVILAFLFKASLSFSKADMLINNSHRDHGDDTDALLNEMVEWSAGSFLWREGYREEPHSDPSFGVNSTENPLGVRHQQQQAVSAGTVNLLCMC